jgi:hypothetical protein
MDTLLLLTCNFLGTSDHSKACTATNPFKVQNNLSIATTTRYIRALSNLVFEDTDTFTMELFHWYQMDGMAGILVSVIRVSADRLSWELQAQN